VIGTQGHTHELAEKLMKSGQIYGKRGRIHPGCWLADLEVAWEIGSSWRDQDFSIVDRTTFAAMRRLGIDHVASLDEHFSVFRFGAKRRHSSLPPALPAEIRYSHSVMGYFPSLPAFFLSRFLLCFVSDSLGSTLYGYNSHEGMTRCAASTLPNSRTVSALM
jgi:hypothetical protein